MKRNGIVAKVKYLVKNVECRKKSDGEECDIFHVNSSVVPTLISNRKTLAMMDLDSESSQLDDGKSINITELLQSNVFLPKPASSPLMFDDEVISNRTQTQPGQPFTFNQTIPSEMSTLPSQWTANFRTPLIEASDYDIRPISHPTDAIVLSVSPTERVSTCEQCIYAENFMGSCSVYDNSSLTGVTVIDGFKGNSDDSFVGSELQIKRTRLDPISEVTDADIPSISEDVADVLRELAESTKAINDRLLSLREDW